MVLLLCVTAFAMVRSPPEAKTFPLLRTNAPTVPSAALFPIPSAPAEAVVLPV